jgi:hypothetical protein
MWEDRKCPICSNPAKQHSNQFDYYSWRCTSCGNYRATLSAADDNLLSGRLKPIDRQRLSGWLSDQQDADSSVTLDSDAFERLKSLRVPTLPERANRFLKRAVKIAAEPLSQISFLDPRLWGTSYSVNESEVRLLVQILINESFVRDVNNPPYFAVTPKGYIEVERQSLVNPEAHQGFVAMWFSADIGSVYFEAIEPAIIDAGYSALRIDKKEHANKIDDEIIAEIRKSRFLVADLSGDRGGVYYEAGFAYGLGLPVIYTCREDWFKKGIHFDIRQFNTIVWTDHMDFRVALKRRIEAVVGPGPKAGN